MIRAAVVGAGGIARQHLGCLRTLDGVEVVGVCDLSPTLAEAVARRFGLDPGVCYSDCEAMLRERRPDVLHVTTPPTAHVPLARLGLEHGAHVLVEKPIALRRPELEQLFELADRRGRWLLENHNFHYNEPVQRLLGWVESGRLGAVTHVEVSYCLDILDPAGPFADPNAPNPLLRAPGGAILDFLPHLCYLAYLFVGGPRRVESMWHKRTPGTPLPHDEMRGLLECERGTAALTFSANTRPDAAWLRVYGTRLQAEVNLFEFRLSAHPAGGGPPPLAYLRNGLREGWDVWWAAWRSLARKLSGGPGAYEGLWELVARLYGALREGGPPPVARAQIDAVSRMIDGLTRGAVAS